MTSPFVVLATRVLHIGLPGPDGEGMLYRWDPRTTPYASFIAQRMTRLFNGVGSSSDDEAHDRVASFLVLMTYVAEGDQESYELLLRTSPFLPGFIPPPLRAWGSWSCEVHDNKDCPVGPFYKTVKRRRPTNVRSHGTLQALRSQANT